MRQQFFKRFGAWCSAMMILLLAFALAVCEATSKAPMSPYEAHVHMRSQAAALSAALAAVSIGSKTSMGIGKLNLFLTSQ